MSQSWNTVRMPTPGDQIALHMEIKHERASVTVRKILFVGPKPWGSKGEMDGSAVAGAEIATADPDDKNFDHFLLWYCRMAVQLVKSEEVESKMAELVLSLQDRGIKEGTEPKTCGACGVGQRETKSFSRTTDFRWMIEPTFKCPRFVSDFACIPCYEKRLKELEGVLDKSTELVSKAPKKPYYNDLGGYFGNENCGSEVAALVGPSTFDKALIPFRNLVRDLKEGKL